MNARIPLEAARNAVVAHAGRPATAVVIDTPRPGERNAAGNMSAGQAASGSR